MRILIVSDAWYPQTNGVVQTLSQTMQWLERFGHQVQRVTPDGFRTIACPSYPEIRLACLPMARFTRIAEEFAAHAVHIATEGPLGLAAWRYCRRRSLPFTTSYHTQFPQYLRARAPVPLALSYRLLRRFHGAAVRCMVSTQSIHDELATRGFVNLARWRRGVDTTLFHPGLRDFLALSLPRPIAVFVGRLAVEKNVEAFLAMRWAGSKLVIGDGPARGRLQRGYPDAHFTGFRRGSDLAAHVAACDVMVFPSRTDTFGLVNLEAMACGVPVAAYPVAGPRDVIREGVTGALDEDLAAAALRALQVDRAACRDYALGCSWDVCTREFERNLAPRTAEAFEDTLCAAEAQ